MNNTMKTQDITFTKAEATFIKVLNTKGYAYTYDEGVVVLHQGYVYLYSLTTLPENTKFENKGDVNLNSLTDEKFKYMGKTIRLKTIDGSTMLITSTKKRDEFTIMYARYFGGGEIKDFKRSYIVQRGEYFAHGTTIQKAIDDVQFKFLQATLNVDTLVRDIKKKATVSIAEYRLLTGACSSGVSHFLKQHDIDEALGSLPLSQVLKIIKGSYGDGKMMELFA